MDYNNENLGSNCYEYNVTKLQNWVLKQTNINNICHLMSSFTGIVRELYDLTMNTNINFPGTLKTSRLFSEQLWIIPLWEFWELGLMIQIWFGQGILYTAKVWDCWHIDCHMYVHMQWIPLNEIKLFSLSIVLLCYRRRCRHTLLG